MKQNLVVGLLLIAAYFLAQWIENHARLPDSKQITSNQQADSFYHNFTTHIINRNGKTEYRFSGNKLLHYDDQHSEIESPVIDLLEDSFWQLKADYGVIDESQKAIYLRQNIVAKNQNNAFEKITAQQLTLYPDQKIMKTGKNIKLYRENSLTTANGMLADLKQDTLTLYDHVITHYYENE